MAMLKTPAEFDAYELHSAIKVNGQEQKLCCFFFKSAFTECFVIHIFALFIVKLLAHKNVKDKESYSYLTWIMEYDKKMC